MNKNRLLLYIFLAVVLILSSIVLVKSNCTQAGTETSRLAVIQSVVDDGTFDVTHSIFKTPDKALLNGKYYGDKPPLLTFLSMGEYFVLSKVFGVTFKTHRSLAIFLLYLPYFLIGCLCSWLFYCILNRYIGNSSSLIYRLCAAVLSFISTLVFSYSVTIGNHVPTAALLLWLILQMDKMEKNQYSVKDLLLGGVIVGLIFNCEFVSGGAFAVGIFFEKFNEAFGVIVASAVNDNESSVTCN